MQLTGKEIIENGLITNYTEEGIQQQGVDVRIARVWRFKEGATGHVPAAGKTSLPIKEEVKAEGGVFRLLPGYYEFSTLEGCVIKEDVCMYLKHRSSLIRCGCAIYSGQFDAGFSTESMGAFLEVKNPSGICIDQGARVAQTIFTKTNVVTNLYEGQYQNDKQRH